MAGGIRGITVKIGGDTTELGKALSTATTQSKNLQKELRGVNTLLKYDPKNVTLLKQKQDLLKESISQTKDKLQALKDVQAKVDSGEIEMSAEEYRNLQREIVSTENNLKNLKKEAFDFGSIGAQKVKLVGEALQGVGGKVETVGKKFSAISAVSGAILGGSVASAEELKQGYDAIAKGTGATGEQLQALKGVANDVYGNMDTSMDNVGAAVADLNTRFGFTDDTLNSATQDFIKFADINNTDVSTAIANVSRYMGDAGIDSSEYASVLDTLTKASQSSGLSVDKLSESLTKYGAPMRALGFDTQESIAIFSQWEQAGVNTEIAFSGMKTAIGTWSKEGKDSREEFKKTLQEIKNCPDIASATTKAIEVFGKKAGPDLADAIQGGRFEYEDFLNVIKDSNGTVSDTYDNTQDATNKAKIALNNLKLAGADLGNTLLTSLAPIMENIIKHVQNLVTKFSSLSPKTKQIIVIALGIVTALGPVLIVIGKVISAVGTILTIVPKVVSVIKLFGTAFKALGAIMAANPIGIVIIAITALVAGFIYLWNNCESFRNFWINLWDKIKTVVSGAVTKIKEFFGKIGDKFSDLKNKMTTTATNIKTKISEKFTDIKNNMTNAMETAKKNIQTKLNNIKSAYESHGGGVKGVVSATMTGIKEYYKTGYDAINTLTGGRLGDVVSKFKIKMGDAKNAVSTKLGDIKTSFSTKLVEIITTVSDKFGSIKDKINEKMEAAKNVVTGAVEKFKSAFKFSWSLPPLKLPHLSVTGGVAPFGIGGKGSLPKFNIQWYKKAMDNALMFTRPTVLSTDSGYKGFGEAGNEIVIGENKLLQTITKAVNTGSDNSDVVYRLQAIEDKLSRLKVVLNSGALVGGMIDQIDARLASNQILRERGV